MFGRALLFVALVVLGAVLPYLLADDVWMVSFKDVWESVVDRSTTIEDASSTARQPEVDPSRIGVAPNLGTRDTGSVFTGTILASPSVTNSPAPRLIGPEGARLEQLLRFDITPEWVTNQWSRVTTRLSNLDLNGWRVPIAMGSTPQDLAGSITYYFDTQRRVQRINVHGYLSDPTALVRLVTTRYSMHRLPSAGGDLYVADIEGKMIGALRLLRPPVVRADAPGQRCAVLMELNRTGTSYGMSREFQEIMQAARDVGAKF